MSFMLNLCKFGCKGKKKGRGLVHAMLCDDPQKAGMQIPNVYVQYWYLIPHDQLVLNHWLQVACIHDCQTLFVPLPANMHHTSQRPKKSLSLRPGCSNLTIFLQLVSCCKSTAVAANGGRALRSGTIGCTIGLRTGHWSRRMSHTSLCISLLQQSLRRPRIGVFLCEVKAWQKAHLESKHVFLLATLLTSSNISDALLLG